MCAEQIASLKADLAIVLADIDVMTTVLEMTDCSTDSTTTTAAPDFLQLATSGGTPLVKCKCKGGKTVVAFKHHKLQSKLAQIKSSALKERVMNDLAALA